MPTVHQSATRCASNLFLTPITPILYLGVCQPPCLQFLRIVAQGRDGILGESEVTSAASSALASLHWLWRWGWSHGGYWRRRRCGRFQRGGGFGLGFRFFSSQAGVHLIGLGRVDAVIVFVRFGQDIL